MCPGSDFFVAPHKVLENTESLRFWSFGVRNDRKQILITLRGNIDLSKNMTTFRILGFLDFCFVFVRVGVWAW